MLNQKLLLFDLDGTLLRSDKTISQRTLEVLHQCRDRGIRVGVSTSRSEQNSLSFLHELEPDVLITSGGAVIKFQGDYLFTAEFSEEETRRMIAIARKNCGQDCEITIDTLTEHYWNYKIDPRTEDATWGETIYTDFQDFCGKTLKMCVEIFCAETAKALCAQLPDCDCIKFSDGSWYKFTKKGITKETAIQNFCHLSGLSLQNVTAFGDDLVDIGMLQLCGTGIAMGNALEEVKAVADTVIGSNDEDGIAEYLTARFL